MYWRPFISKLKKEKGVYMMTGNGSKRQFKDMRVVKKYLRRALRLIPLDSAVLYFGDKPNPKKPDIGLLFKLAKKLRPDLRVYMIQIKQAKKYGVPSFVKSVYWHNPVGNIRRCKYGGFFEGRPCSNTKKWIQIHKHVGIKRFFAFGGGPVAKQDIQHAKRLHIKTTQYRVRSKYAS